MKDPQVNISAQYGVAFNYRAVMLSCMEQLGNACLS
jgi:hypothetical protein